jgi:hypothetical protein
VGAPQCRRGYQRGSTVSRLERRPVVTQQVRPPLTDQGFLSVPLERRTDDSDPRGRTTPSVRVLTLLEGKRITPAQAAEALGLTPRQVRRFRWEGKPRSAEPSGTPGIESSPGDLRRRDRSPGVEPMCRPERPSPHREAQHNGGHSGESGPSQTPAGSGRGSLSAPAMPASASAAAARRAQAGLLCQLDGSPFEAAKTIESGYQVIAWESAATGKPPRRRVRQSGTADDGQVVDEVACSQQSASKEHRREEKDVERTVAGRHRHHVDGRLLHPVTMRSAK